MKNRSVLITAALLAAWAAVAPAPARGELLLDSPDGAIQFRLSFDQPRLRYAVTFNGAMVVEWSPLVFTIDGVDATTNVATAGDTDRYEFNATYLTRGGHSVATDHYSGARVPLKLMKGDVATALEIRAFDDGVAFRFVAPGDAGKERVPDEATVFTLPAKSTVWHHNLRGHYEGDYVKNDVSEIAAHEWAAPPMTFKLPGDGGYASVTEAALFNYSGMALECDGKRGFAVGLAHRQPVSYPYELRYSKADVERLSHPAKIAGTITTPWRVVLIGRDLNTLVNNDVVTNLCPPPDKKYFPQGLKTDWIKPGRAVWRYLDNARESGPADPLATQRATKPQAARESRAAAGAATTTAPATTQRIRVPATPADAQTYSRLAGELGFEYNVLEGYWRRFSDDQLRDLVKFSRDRGVGLFVWLHSKDLHDAATRQKLFAHCHELGIAGLKIDFFDHEHKETIDLYEAIRRDAAADHLLLNFHGANKPTGEERTWPNELNREAVRGMEASRLSDRATHNTTLPFTRMLVGPADYTPVIFSERRGNTTIAHQIASAAVFTETLLTYAANPQKLLDSPAVEMIKSIPATWDQTIVLPGSEIGQCAAFARRRGEMWFVAMINGNEPRTVDLPLKLLGAGGGEYHALVVRDEDGDGTGVKVETVPAAQVGGSIKLKAGGGFIARFTK